MKQLLDFNKIGHSFPTISGRGFYEVVNSNLNEDTIWVKRPNKGQNVVKVKKSLLYKILFNSNDNIFLSELWPPTLGESLPAAIFTAMGIAKCQSVDNKTMLRFRNKSTNSDEVFWHAFSEEWKRMGNILNELSFEYIRHNWLDTVNGTKENNGYLKRVEEKMIYGFKSWYRKWKKKEDIENYYNNLKEHYKSSTSKKIFFIVNYYALKPGLHECYYLKDHWPKLKEKDSELVDWPELSIVEMKTEKKRHNARRVHFSIDNWHKEYIKNVKMFGKYDVDKNILSHIRGCFRTIIFQSFRSGFNILEYNCNFQENDMNAKDKLNRFIEIVNPKNKQKSIRNKNDFQNLYLGMASIMSTKDINIIFSNCLSKSNAITYSPCMQASGPLFLLKNNHKSYSNALYSVTKTKYRASRRNLKAIIESKENRQKGKWNMEFKYLPISDYLYDNKPRDNYEKTVKKMNDFVNKGQ